MLGNYGKRAQNRGAPHSHLVCIAVLIDKVEHPETLIPPAPRGQHGFGNPGRINRDRCAIAIKLFLWHIVFVPLESCRMTNERNVPVYELVVLEGLSCRRPDKLKGLLGG